VAERLLVKSRHGGGVLTLTVAGLAAGVPAAVAAAPTVVTLTFDDGTADQLNAAQILNDSGLKGTFFIPSGAVGTPNYLTLANLQGLAAAGHEIAGHTVTHPDLTTLTSDQATRQICNDRVNLTNWGFRVTNIAYPFAGENATIEAIVKNCGYWTSSPWLAASGSYVQASFTTPVLPAGATAISFDLNLFGNGTLTTDDYAMYDTVGAPVL
jgi:peptidoglycan/xylan/chitin deacetylase (PgdA/CDA1 family)